MDAAAGSSPPIAQVMRPARMSPRMRWIVLVTAAETLGFLVPVLTGITTTRAAFAPGLQALLIVAAGMIEGLALGLGQAYALPMRVRRARFTLLTALGAGVVWMCIMAAMHVATFAVAAIASLFGLAAIGSAQWIELRHHAARAHRWIAWTALAWVLALPLSFAPGLLVDETTPLRAQVVLWGAGGLLMAFTMAVVTWQGVRRLAPRISGSG
jgi:hypothetical protein